MVLLLDGAAATGAAAGDKPAAAGADQQAQITKIEAKGDVIINSAQDQTTTSDWALYDVPAQLVTVGGNVVLTPGSECEGDRLVIDLKTGEKPISKIQGIPRPGAVSVRCSFRRKGL